MKSNAEIAGSFSLWQEYVDPSGLMSEEEFDAMTLEEKITFQVNCFGPETDEPTPEEAKRIEDESRERSAEADFNSPFGKEWSVEGL